ncbi:hypothetical protein B4135_4247 [Caldibacillus debilis]|uniref:Uncharacterized protein n=1 Tax=Caldibacillus debilis TaxID=301148 RepID=A0A150L6E5_9BACI|nr:hypothetical protein B4135_4247 [Caldibacillus debilis]
MGPSAFSISQNKNAVRYGFNNGRRKRAVGTGRVPGVPELSGLRFGRKVKKPAVQYQKGAAAVAKASNGHGS